MTGKKLIVLALLVVVAATVAIAADQPTGGMAVGQSRTITLYEPAVVGGTTLPAGNYAVKHTMEGDNHIMVFSQKDGKATAKVNCKMVPLEKKAERSAQTFASSDQGRSLTSLTWKGDTIRHEF